MIWWPISCSPWTNIYQDESLRRTKTNRGSTIAVFFKLSGRQNGRKEEPCIAAFLRRPSLRRYVRTIIFARGSTIITEASADKMFECARQELDLMSSVVKLEWRHWFYAPGFPSSKFMLFVPVLENMTSLQEILFPSVVSQIVPSPQLTKRLKRITFDHTPSYGVSMHTSPWFLSTSGHLEALTFDSPRHLHMATFLSNFSKLRILRLKHVVDPAELVASLRSMSRLRELSFSLRITDAEYAPGESLRLEHLQILNIKLHRESFWKHLIPILRPLYECLTSNSKQIQEVYLPFELHPYRRTTHLGDKILTNILHFHPNNIRCLRVDRFGISPEALLKIGLRLPCLQELGFFTNGKECIPLLSILRIVSSLEVLWVTMPKSAEWPTDQEIKSFMIQEMPQLRRLHLHRVYPFTGTFALWENHWMYDSESKEKVRIVAQNTNPRGVENYRYLGYEH